mgnify:CR=1 FL=1
MSARKITRTANEARQGRPAFGMQTMLRASLALAVLALVIAAFVIL